MVTQGPDIECPGLPPSTKQFMGLAALDKRASECPNRRPDPEMI